MISPSIWTALLVAVASFSTAVPRTGEGLKPLTGIGPVPPEEWKVIQPKGGPSSDTFSVKRPTQGLVIEDTILMASSRTAFICFSHRGPFRNVVLRNSIIKVEPGTIALDRSYWAVRGYDMIDTVFERIEITGFGKITPKHDEGHAIYLNVAGAFTLEESDIHHNGGQGLQLVNRPLESDMGGGPAEGAVILRRTRFKENGFNPDRGGFQVSIFGTGQSIVLEDVEITAGLDGTDFPTGKTGGGLLIEAEAYEPHRKNKPVWWRPAELPKDWEMPFAQGRVEMTGVKVHHRDPNRSLVQIKGCEELIVRGCEFRGGRVVLDHPEKPGRDCGRIIWEGNFGGAAVYHRGKRIGRADEDFVITP